MLDVGKHRKRSRSEEPGVETAVDVLYDRLHRGAPALYRLQDRLLAPFTVHEISPDQALRILDASAVTRQIDRVVARQHTFQRLHVVTHAAFRRRDDARAPGHDVIAREHEAGAVEDEAQMVGRVAGRVHRGRPPAGTGHAVAVTQHDVGVEIAVHVFAAGRARAPGAGVRGFAPVAAGRRAGGVLEALQAV